jgi:RsmE family RNA methyltransferase
MFIECGSYSMELAVGGWQLTESVCQLPTANCQLSTVNLILLFDDDFVSADRVRLSGRRLRHVLDVHRAAVGDELTVGVAGGRVGRGAVVRLDADALEMDVALDADPPAPLPLTLVLALLRPKVLNRVIAGVASLGVKRIFLVNAWRVEKSYWKSPRLDHLREQSILGLEQAKDTLLPSIELRRLFRPFVEDELPAMARGTRALVAHPSAAAECPRDVREPVTLAVGPEGGFIAEEIASLERIGFEPVTVGARVLRVETAVAAIIGRLF